MNYAICFVLNSSGNSLTGKCIIAENAPTPTPTHHTTSYEPYLSYNSPPNQTPTNDPI